MELINFEGFKYIDGGVCSAKGFKASGATVQFINIMIEIDEATGFELLKF